MAVYVYIYIYICKYKVKNYNYRKNKIRPNEAKIWKNTEAQPKLSGSYKNKKCK